ncbi:hypothetical protein ABTF70_18635, partial [Acinetobacter baumannii]
KRRLLTSPRKLRAKSRKTFVEIDCLTLWWKRVIFAVYQGVLRRREIQIKIRRFMSKQEIRGKFIDMFN